MKENSIEVKFLPVVAGNINTKFEIYISWRSVQKRQALYSLQHAKMKPLIGCIPFKANQSEKKQTKFDFSIAISTNAALIVPLIGRHETSIRLGTHQVKVTDNRTKLQSKFFLKGANIDDYVKYSKDLLSDQSKGYIKSELQHFIEMLQRDVDAETFIVAGADANLAGEKRSKARANISLIEENLDEIVDLLIERATPKMLDATLKNQFLLKIEDICNGDLPSQLPSALIRDLKEIRNIKSNAEIKMISMQR